MKAEILPPLSATLHVRPAGWRRSIRLWLPLFLLWLLLMPIFLLLLPVFLIAALIFRFRPLQSLAALLRLLAAFRGADGEVDRNGTRIFFKMH